MMAHTICKKDEAYFSSMVQEVFDFLKGQDDKIIDDSRVRWQRQPRLWNLNVAEYRDLIQAIGTLRTKQRVMANDSNVMSWLPCGQGLMWFRFLCSSR